MKFFDKAKVFPTNKKFYPITVNGNQINNSTQMLVEQYNTLLASLDKKPYERPNFESLLESVTSEQASVSTSATAKTSKVMLDLLKILITDLIYASFALSKEIDHQTKYDRIEKLSKDWSQLKSNDPIVKSWFDSESFYANLHNLKSRLKRNIEEMAPSSDTADPSDITPPIRKSARREEGSSSSQTASQTDVATQATTTNNNHIESKEISVPDTVSELLTQLEQIQNQVALNAPSDNLKKKLICKSITFFVHEKNTLTQELGVLEARLKRQEQELRELQQQLQNAQSQSACALI